MTIVSTGDALSALLVIKARLLAPSEITDATANTIDVARAGLGFLAKTRRNVALLLSRATTRLTRICANGASANTAIITVFLERARLGLWATTIYTSAVTITICVSAARLFALTTLADAVSNARVVGSADLRLLTHPEGAVTYERTGTVRVPQTSVNAELVIGTNPPDIAVFIDQTNGTLGALAVRPTDPRPWAVNVSSARVITGTTRTHSRAKTIHVSLANLRLTTDPGDLITDLRAWAGLLLTARYTFT